MIHKGIRTTRMADAFEMPSTPSSQARAATKPRTSRAPRQPIVVKGRVEPLANVPFHREGPLTRWLMASAALDPALNCHIAVHQFEAVPRAERTYCDVHVHDYD